MKKSLFAILLCACSITATNHKATAQSILVHYWHFNNVTAADDTIFILPSAYCPGAPGFFDADYTRIASPTASMVFQPIPALSVSSAYTTLLDVCPAADASDTVNSNPVGFFGASPVPPGNGIKARNRCDSSELLFYIPTTHYRNINFSFGLEMSGTNGAWFQKFQYSTDSGMTWQTTGLSFTGDTCSSTQYNLVSVNISNPAANDNPRLVFQITFDQNDTMPAYQGNDRFDNFSVTADSIPLAVPTPSTLPNFEDAITMSPNPATDFINLNTTADMEKSVTIFNAAGESVFAGIMNGKNNRLNISKYSAGVYFVKVTTFGSKNSQMLKFIKE